MENILSIENLEISFNKKKVIKNISLDIKEKTITAIIGPSGCGKSTFLKSINRILEEEEEVKITGNIVLQNKDIMNLEKEDIRRDIGMVFQNPTPFPMSIYKNITYAPNYYGVKDKKTLEETLRKSLKSVGLYEEIKDELNKSALKLSGGQQQRLCIARALAIEPKILLLDEPCSALDVKSTEVIEKMLKELSKEYTIIIVTHNLNQAKRIADNTAFILNGELIEYDKTENIFTRPKREETKDYIGGIYG